MFQSLGESLLGYVDFLPKLKTSRTNYLSKLCTLKKNMKYCIGGRETNTAWLPNSTIQAGKIENSIAGWYMCYKIQSGSIQEEKVALLGGTSVSMADGLTMVHNM